MTPMQKLSKFLWCHPVLLLLKLLLLQHNVSASIPKSAARSKHVLWNYGKDYLPIHMQDTSHGKVSWHQHIQGAYPGSQFKIDGPVSILGNVQKSQVKTKAKTKTKAKSKTKDKTKNKIMNKTKNKVMDKKRTNQRTR